MRKRVGERGGALSGGQQAPAIALARPLSSIVTLMFIILDDPLAALRQFSVNGPCGNSAS